MFRNRGLIFGKTDVYIVMVLYMHQYRPSCRCLHWWYVHYSNPILYHIL